MKPSITVEDWRPANADEQHEYYVKSCRNTMIFSVGNWLSGKEIKALIDDGEINITIVAMPKRMKLRQDCQKKVNRQ